VTVRDSDGVVVFESGGVDDSGAIRGNDHDADARRYEPHYERITGAEQVQIYEPVLGDVAGVPTTGLLTATQYLKDNRLLPRGFDKATAPREIGVFGDAASDPDFSATGDRVRYAVETPGRGPHSVDVELRYQPIAYRWARNLEAYDTEEPRRFLAYYRSMSSSSSIVVGRAVAEARSGSPRQAP